MNFVTCVGQNMENVTVSKVTKIITGQDSKIVTTIVMSSSQDKTITKILYHWVRYRDRSRVNRTMKNNLQYETLIINDISIYFCLFFQIFIFLSKIIINYNF